VSSISTSVVICAWTMERWSQMVAAVASVQDQHPRPDQVILVIDHCDELLELSAVSFDPTVQVIASTGSPGLSGARNTGVAAATGEVVLFLDDDAAARPGWLAGHARHYEDADVLGVGGLVVPAWADRRPDWFPPEFGWVVGCSYVGQPTATAEIRNPIGANMSFRRRSVRSVGGFSESMGRIGAGGQGCEETELSLRLVGAFPNGRILFDPEAAAHHHVPSERGTWSYFRRRCLAEGRSKATMRRLEGSRAALGTERDYVRSTLPRAVRNNVSLAVGRRDVAPLTQALAVCAGLAITTAGFVVETGRRRPTTEKQRETPMTTKTAATDEWLHFDLHGMLGIRLQRDAPAAAQLRIMLGCFASTSAVPADIVVSRDFEEVPVTAQLENELNYSPESVEFVEDRVQVVRDGGQVRIHGEGELLTTLIPILDRAMVERGAGMIHAATVAYRGYAIALPAGGGTGKTSTVAKLMRREGYSFMGDDWAFLGDDRTLLGYSKPMFIRSHHRTIYPHLFQGARKPMVPTSLSRPLGRVTTVVHPHIIRYPRLAHLARRWSPEHRMVDAARALPGVAVTQRAPLLASIYVERHSSADVELTEVTRDWMVDRVMGNFHIEMPTFSQALVTAMAATSMTSWSEVVTEKRDVLAKGLDGLPCYLLRVPTRLSADQASDAVVAVLDELVPSLLDDEASAAS
jgi:GT2 family glycosyltransferase